MVIATTGFFDGVHTGHRKVIDTLCRTAKERGGESVVVTFWPHPRNVLRQDARELRLLNSLEEKKELLKECGVDRVEVVDFTKSLSKISCEQFIQECLIGQIGASMLIVGYDHHLGNTAFDTNVTRVAKKLGLETIKAGSVSDQYNTVSSTYIRNLVATGGIERANKLLGYDYRLGGVVVSGNGIGRQLGFPTANMQLYEPLKVIPERGVYAVRVQVEGGRYIGVCNIGTRPTVCDDRALVIETHILDFDEEIYGLDIRLDFCSKLREERKFASREQLKAQLSQDIAATRELFASGEF
ncbi:MAG: bifunctional riboflavin kinase/FAD synthetase [Bacteroidales bacterium]|nr:bifunctional riboflavin kinase/FAD synthetase [Bacteroidales bacterium]